MDEHAALIINRRCEKFTGFHWNGRVAGNDYIHEAAKRFDTQR